MPTDTKQLLKQFQEVEDEIKSSLLRIRGAVVNDDIDNELVYIADIQNSIAGLEGTLEDLQDGHD